MDAISKINLEFGNDRKNGVIPFPPINPVGCPTVSKRPFVLLQTFIKTKEEEKHLSFTRTYMGPSYLIDSADGCNMVSPMQNSP